MNTSNMTDISSYTSAAAPFEVPEDGYVRVSGNGDTVQILNNNESTGGIINFISSSGNFVAAYVRKGTKLIVSGTTARYIKLLA